MAAQKYLTADDPAVRWRMKKIEEIIGVAAHWKVYAKRYEVEVSGDVLAFLPRSGDYYTDVLALTEWYRAWVDQTDTSDVVPF